MRRRNAAAEPLSHEFELDLAPLLAVMVKLVPVLIVSSAFVPIVVIHSELPAAVVAAINETKTEPPPQLELMISPDQGIDLKLTQAEKNLDQVHISFPKNINDLDELKQNLVKMKRQAPQLFQLDLLPKGDIPLEMIVKVMDAARKSPGENEKFKFNNPQTGTAEETSFMYPNVVFANILEE